MVVAKTRRRKMEDLRSLHPKSLVNLVWLSNFNTKRNSMSGKLKRRMKQRQPKIVETKVEVLLVEMISRN